jgi:Na+-translocating ferredoxin:NAD+ oxidoreductase RnfG subunit
MRRRSLIKGLLPASLATRADFLYAETYLSPEQAQQVLFPGAQFTPALVTLSTDQKKTIEKTGNVRVRELQVKAWRTSIGGWFILDNAVGKHEFIDFALGLNGDGSVKGIEIMTYRETYGGEVRNPKWRAQFTGKSASSSVRIDKDIRNISGATLSSVHITDAVRRLLCTYEVALKNDH